MNNNLEQIKITQEWFKYAKGDLQSARNLVWVYL